MADKESIVVEDLPSTNFMLNPYFYKLLNYSEDKTKFILGGTFDSDVTNYKGDNVII